QFATEEFARPWACRVHQGPGAQHFPPAGGMLQFGEPCCALALCRETGTAREDPGPPLRRVNGVEGDQPSVVDPAVGIFEADPKSRPQSDIVRWPPEIDLARRRQALPSPQMIVAKQSQTE